MLTKNQIKILEPLLKQPYREFTFSELRTNSNSQLQNAIKKFTEHNLIKTKSIANIKLYSLNTENSKVFSYANILRNLPPLVLSSLNILNKELPVFTSVVIFGSYANQTQNNDSDLDIAIFTLEKCESAVNEAKLKSILNIDAHIFTKSEMLQMLRDKEENLGKQIACKHIAITNPEIFYKILNEGINNGFKVVYAKSEK